MMVMSAIRWWGVEEPLFVLSHLLCRHFAYYTQAGENLQLTGMSEATVLQVLALRSSDCSLLYQL